MKLFSDKLISSPDMPRACILVNKLTTASLGFLALPTALNGLRRNLASHPPLVLSVISIVVFIKIIVRPF